MKVARRRITTSIAALFLLVSIIVFAVISHSMGSRSDLIAVGQPAPDFSAKASDGGTVHLSTQQGYRRVVLVFYPGDYTPVCTAQLCSFRDAWAGLQAEKTVVYGINPAGVAQHAGFAEQNRLPFPLIEDANGDIARRYGCRAPFGLVKRTVYVIDRRGKVAWVERGNPSPSTILPVLRSLADEAVR